MASKNLDTATWRGIASRSGVDEGDLQKQLTALNRLQDDDYDGRLAALDKVAKAAIALQKDKQAAAQAAVAKFLKDLIKDAESEQGELKKAKAKADGEAKAAADKAKADAKNAASAKEDDEEKGDYKARLTSALNNLRSAKNPYHCIVNEAKPLDFFWLSRGLINSSSREMLTELSGSKKFSKPGTVTREGKTLFIDIAGVSKGMASRVQRAIQKGMGTRFTIQIGAEKADEMDEDPADRGSEDPGSGKGSGKSSLPTAAVQSAAKTSAKTPPKAPPKPPVELKKAPLLWRGTSDLVAKRIGLLKDAVRQHYGSSGAALLADIDKNLVKLDAITDKLDDRLAAALEAAHKAPEAQRAARLAEAKRIANEYSAYIEAEPLIDHIDGNPFGVQTQLQTLITKSLGELTKSMG